MSLSLGAVLSYGFSLAQGFLDLLGCCTGPALEAHWPGFIFIYLFAFRAAPVVYEHSQARRQIGAAAASLHHSSQQCRILKPLSKARDGTGVLMDASQVH